MPHNIAPSATHKAKIDFEIGSSDSGGDEWASNRSGTKPKEYRIRFNHPDSAETLIKWNSRKSPNTWPEIPLILDLVSGQPVIYTIIGTSRDAEEYRKYVFRNEIWSEEVLPDTFETLTTNLSLKLGEGMPKFMDLENKRKINSDACYRKSIKQVGPNRTAIMN